MQPNLSIQTCTREETKTHPAHEGERECVRLSQCDLAKWHFQSLNRQRLMSQGPYVGIRGGVRWVSSLKRESLFPMLKISLRQKRRQKESKRIIGVEDWRVEEIRIKIDRWREYGERD